MDYLTCCDLFIMGIVKEDCCKICHFNENVWNTLNLGHRIYNGAFEGQPVRICGAIREELITLSGGDEMIFAWNY